MLQIIKRAAAEVFAQSRPCDISTARVTSVSPLEITLQSGLAIPSALLVVVGEQSFSVLDPVAVLRKTGGQVYYILGKVATV